MNQDDFRDIPSEAIRSLVRFYGSHWVSAMKDPFHPDFHKPTTEREIQYRNIHNELFTLISRRLLQRQ